MSNRTIEQDVERELLLDRMIFGTSYHKIVDGKKVRVDPRDVYYAPPRLKRWVRLREWIRRQFRRLRDFR